MNFAPLTKHGAVPRCHTLVMAKELRSVDPADQSTAAAQVAAGRAGIRIVELEEIQALHEASLFFNRVWMVPESHLMISGATLRALAHADNYVVAAYRDDVMVGASVGFVGFHNGALHLHSHITGVSADVQGKNIGFALKQHQRAWALARGIDLITWTFDPLVGRNAYFNIAKLGAAVTAYYESFYGEMNDGINDKDETDRVLVEWELDSSRAAEASVGRLPEPDVDALQRSGARIALSVGDTGEPRVDKGTPATALLVAVPRDIVELRHSDEELAQQWRVALRDVLGGALNDGFVTTGMTRTGFYLLTK